MVRYQQKTAESKPRKANLNSAVGVDRELLLNIAQTLTDQAQQLATSVESRLSTPLSETTGESQENTKQLLDWVADLYSIGSDINAYLNPEVESE